MPAYSESLTMTDSSDRTALTRAAEHAFAWLDGLDTRSVATTASVADLRARLGRPLADQGVAATRVIDDLVADTAGGILGSQSGRFFGWVIGGGTPAAMAADWLTTAWDQNAGVHACGPAASVVEEVAAGWLREIFDFGPQTSVGFVTGKQMAHMTCLAAARHALLRDGGWDVERQGLAGAPAIRILANAERHGSVDRAVRFLGLGSDSIEDLPVDGGGQVAPDILSAALAASQAPTIVVLQAGELNRGAFDPFEALAPMARAAGAWTHVDGAFGLWAKASPAHRELVRGLELCDSWTTDAHKYLNVPYDSGLAFVRDAAAHRAALTLSTSYLPAGDARDQIDWNPEFSRRARGFAVYAALRELGREGLADLVDRTCRHAQAIVAGVAALPGADRMGASSLNQGLVRFLSPSPDATEADHDRRTDQVIAAVNAGGEAFFGGVTWRDRRCMRVSLCNWRTTDADVARTIAAVRAVLAAKPRTSVQAAPTPRSAPDRPVVLRPPAPGDMGWVTERHAVTYGREYGWGAGIEAVTARICADFLEAPESDRQGCWIAERDGERIGCVFLVKESDEVARLRLLLLEPGARGTGLGRRLVEECIAFARAAGYREIVLWTHAVLTAARAIYAATGFTLEATWTHDDFGEPTVAETWRLKL